MPLSLLDTDMLSEVLKQKDPHLTKKAAAYLQQYQQFSFSAITRYEVIRGRKDKGATKQLQKFTTFCQHSLILPITDAIFDRAADLWVASPGQTPWAGHLSSSERATLPSHIATVAM